MATVLRIKDNEDGSANVTLELSDEEIGLLLNDAINRALEAYLDAQENNRD